MLPVYEYELTNAHTQVNTNGLLSFDTQHTSASPLSFPFGGQVLISPFWADINADVVGRDTGVQGRIFYRFSSITSSIRNQLDLYIRDSSFSPSLIFIATWDGVAEFASTGQDVSIIHCYD